jgi:cyclopropane-fatty-acyl-phospholipid synthase
LFSGDIGFAESFMAGEWHSDDLSSTLELIATNLDYINAEERHPVAAWLAKRLHHSRGNTLLGSRKNISAHYDLGNAFYARWLDNTMSYSSAVFDGVMDLEMAQTEKYRRIFNLAGIQPHQRVLEIGCGWGGFAEFAAQRNANVVGLTLSEQQHNYAIARLEMNGLEDLTTIRLQDYRDVEGQFDHIVSIEMFEAVGKEYWQTYFEVLKERLRPGGRAVLQIITIREDLFDAYEKSPGGFIQKYIFPGGMLPSPTALRREVEKAGLNVSGSIEFGESYSQTLRRWHDVFNDRWDGIRQMGFDDRFRRMWNFYLCSCAATFHSGNCDVTQITVKRPA